jgi:hypothetical protein
MQIQPQSEWMMQRPQGALGSPAKLPAFQAGFGQSNAPDDASPPPALPVKSVQQQSKGLSVEAHQKKQDYGNASRWVTAYKLGFSLFVAGAANAFLFGVPLWWAGGLSAIVAAAQSGIALKVHKEDTDFSKKLVGFTRKVMRREKDQTPAGKEWSMVPIWGAACGAMALVEAGFNHIYSLRHPHKSADGELAERLAKIQEGIDKQGLLKPLYKLQKSGVENTRKAKHWLSQEFPKYLHPRLKSMYHGFTRGLEKNMKGNPKAGYLVGFTLAGIGGIAQTSIAAKIQERIDRKQATNPKALLSAIKVASPLKKLGNVLPEKKPDLEPAKNPELKLTLTENAQPPIPANDKQAKKAGDEAQKPLNADTPLPPPVKQEAGKDSKPVQGSHPQALPVPNPWLKALAD